MDVRTLPTHPGTGLTAIGVVGGRPVWPIAGGAEVDPGDGDEDGDGDVEEEDEEDDGDGDGEEDGDDWTPPTKEELDAERAKAAAKLKRANGQAQRLREELKAKDGPAPAKKTAPAKKAAPKADEVEETTAAVDDGELERWQVRAIRADARAALVERGCNPKMVKLVLGQLVPTEVEWEGDDPVLEDWLDQMEEEYEGLFAKPAAAAKALPRKAGSIDQGAAATGTPAKPRKDYGAALLERGGWGTERRSGLPGRRA